MIDLTLHAGITACNEKRGFRSYQSIGPTVLRSVSQLPWWTKDSIWKLVDGIGCLGFMHNDAAGHATLSYRLPFTANFVS